MGNRGFLIQKFRTQATSFSNRKLESIIITLAEANMELRQQRFSEELVLETLTFKLAKKY